MMDRLEAMRVFVTALNEGSLAGAGRRLGRSPAAVTRAVAYLERHVGVQLLQRTTRTMRPTEAGERYASTCQRVLTDLDEADMSAIGERAVARGLLTITAPVMFGTHILRPIIGAFLSAQPSVQMRYLLLDRLVNLIDEGVDAALRIAHLPDSALIAIRVRRSAAGGLRRAALSRAQPGGGRAGGFCRNTRVSGSPSSARARHGVSHPWLVARRPGRSASSRG